MLMVPRLPGLSDFTARATIGCMPRPGGAQQCRVWMAADYWDDLAQIAHEVLAGTMLLWASGCLLAGCDHTMAQGPGLRA